MMSRMLPALRAFGNCGAPIIGGRAAVSVTSATQFVSSLVFFPYASQTPHSPHHHQPTLIVPSPQGAQCRGMARAARTVGRHGVMTQVAENTGRNNLVIGGLALAGIAGIGIVGCKQNPVVPGSSS